MYAKTIKRVLREAGEQFPIHKRLRCVEKRVVDWLECEACGTIWKILFDGNGKPLFEELVHGNDSCRPPAEPLPEEQEPCPACSLPLRMVRRKGAAFSCGNRRCKAFGFTAEEWGGRAERAAEDEHRDQFED